jgi:hypothetical protein
VRMPWHRGSFGSEASAYTALMPVDARTDLENLVVTTHPTFQAIVERSRRGMRPRALA